MSTGFSLKSYHFLNERCLKETKNAFLKRINQNLLMYYFLVISFIFNYSKFNGTFEIKFRTNTVDQKLLNHLCLFLVNLNINKFEIVMNQNKFYPYVNVTKDWYLIDFLLMHINTWKRVFKYCYVSVINQLNISHLLQTKFKPI